MTRDIVTIHGFFNYKHVPYKAYVQVTFILPVNNNIDYNISTCTVNRNQYKYFTNDVRLILYPIPMFLVTYHIELQNLQHNI